MIQFCERHLWPMLAVTIVACAAALFAGHRVTLHAKAEAAQHARVLAAR